jgi:hypothetical protein
MNERIRELAKQATIRVNNPTVNSNGEVICDNWEEGVSLSKFAELIVRECAELTRWKEFDMSVEQRIRLRVYQDIKEHFGVEE